MVFSPLKPQGQASLLIRHIFVYPMGHHCIPQSKVAQRVRATVAKPEGLSLVSSTHMMGGGGKPLPQAASDLHVYAMECMCVHAHT